MRRLSLGDVSRAILERDGEVKFLAKVKKSVVMVGEELLLSETYEELGMEEMRGTLGWSNRRRVALDDLRKRCIVEDMRLVRVNELSDEEWHELGVSWIGDLKWLAVKKYIRESLYCEFEEDMRLWEIKVRMVCSE